MLLVDDEVEFVRGYRMSVLNAERRVEAADLRFLFHGPDHFLHLREDAAAKDEGGG